MLRMSKSGEGWLSMRPNVGHETEDASEVVVCIKGYNKCMLFAACMQPGLVSLLTLRFYQSKSA